MSNLAVPVVRFAPGMLLRRSGRLPPDAYKAFNAFIINVVLPALILRHVHGLSLDGRSLLPAATDPSATPGPLSPAPAARRSAGGGGPHPELPDTGTTEGNS